MISKPQESASHLEQLRQDFAVHLPHKARQMSDLWNHLRYQKWSDRGFKSLQNLVHRLAGSGTNFGMPALSSVASELDQYWQQQNLQKSPQLKMDFERVDKWIKELATQMNRSTAPTPISQTLTNSQPSTKTNSTSNDELVASTKPSTAETSLKKIIFLVDADHPLCALTVAHLQAAQYQVQHFEQVEDCLLQLELQTPHALLIDPEIIDDSAFDRLEHIKTHLPDAVPMVVLSARTDMHARLKALRCGGESYITKPIHFDALLQNLERLIGRNNVSHKVVIVDDEPLVADYHAAILKHAGMEVICVNNPMHFLQIAKEFNPDLVLMDMHMPDVNGIELAKLFRQDEKFLVTPMIFITADTSTKLHQSIESLGVNGVLTKPVDMGALINICERAINDTFTLKQRIEHVTQRSKYPNQITRSYFFAAVEQELQDYNSTSEYAALYYIGFNLSEDFRNQLSAADWIKLREQFCATLAKELSKDEPWADLSNLIACVLAGRKTAAQHQTRAQDLQTFLSEQIFQLDDQTIQLDAYIGGCHLTRNISSARGALDLAEQAFNRALSADDETDAASEETNLIDSPAAENQTAEIDNAIAEQAFSAQLPLDSLGLSYQPMISFEQSQVVHYETQVRWRANDNELIPAAKFLHYIKHSSMRIELDRWVLESALAEMSQHRHARDNASLFIHLADETLAQKTFFLFAANVLRASRLRGTGRLVFIFEEIWVRDHVDEAVTVFTSLRNIHCDLCLSHAGSTLDTELILKKFAFDYVRIDPELTAQLGENADKDKRLAQIIHLAKHSNAQVIATQVENSKNLSTLWLQGVRLFQGFALQAPEQKFQTHNELDIAKNIAAAQPH